VKVNLNSSGGMSAKVDPLEAGDLEILTGMTRDELEKYRSVLYDS
jgi:hypothetical protein